jgi:prephenate dehydrogenase
MKRTAVIGLGIIGASLARALKEQGLSVDGYDLSQETLDFALSNGYIDGVAENIHSYDNVFLAIPPKAAISVLQNAVFKDGAFVADICGVKGVLEEAVYAAPRNYRYVGLHPMAGKETSGIQSSSAKLFCGANLVITVAKNTDAGALQEAKEFARLLGFGKIVECTAEEHDEKIALTSQLAHIVSNAYVKSEQVAHCDGFTGGSFQDMTRIAGVDEQMWTELYMLNRPHILAELEGLIEHLTVYKNAILEEDEEKLRRVLAEGKAIRKKIKRKND